MTITEVKNTVTDLLKNKLGIQDATIVPITKGVSTNVFNINPNQENLFIRIQKEKTIAYTPVVTAHQRAANLNIHVPEVIYHEDFSPVFDGYSL